MREIIWGENIPMGCVSILSPVYLSLAEKQNLVNKIKPCSWFIIPWPIMDPRMAKLEKNRGGGVSSKSKWQGRLTDSYQAKLWRS